MGHLIVIHGYGGTPDSGWKGWLRSELTAQGWTVELLTMPSPDEPVLREWVSTALQATLAAPEMPVLLGHSLGSITALRVLESLPEERRVAGLVLLAGFGRNLHDPRYSNLDPFTAEPVDWEHVKARAGRVVVVHAPDDPVVPYAEGQWLHEQLGGELLTLPEGYRHCSSSAGCISIPELLGALTQP